MYCPSCRAEFRPGFSRCRECEVDLVDELPSADADAGAGVDALVPLPPIDSPALLGDWLERLEEAGIPYVVTAGTALALADGGALIDAATPDSWRARVEVLAARRADAERLLRAALGG
jgi:hypothetical protein